MPLVLPSDVVDWLRGIFATCNQRVTTKLSRNPNLPEESLDLTWIEHLSRYSAPRTLASDWTVQLETHFLGGLRHWRAWEIADIGLLLFARLAPTTAFNKVALLQSKRLYPTTGAVEEETRTDYEIGFARLADPEVLAQPLAFARDYEFTTACRYGALRAGSDQVGAIKEYQQAVGTRVYYQFYNPWTLPLTQRIPLRGDADPSGALTHGSRIVPAGAVHEFLDAQSDNYRPSVDDLASMAGVADGIGWPIEDFVADEWLSCREGDRFDSVSDEPIQRLFYRRSGPIAAAISIRIEAPEAVG